MHFPRGYKNNLTKKNYLKYKIKFSKQRQSRIHLDLQQRLLLTRHLAKGFVLQIGLYRILLNHHLIGGVGDHARDGSTHARGGSAQTNQKDDKPNLTKKSTVKGEDQHPKRHAHLRSQHKNNTQSEMKNASQEPGYKHVIAKKEDSPSDVEPNLKPDKNQLMHN